MGLAHAFYAAERARWPDLHDLDITDAWAKRALKKLTRHFKLDQLPYGNGPVKLTFAGRSTSWGGRGGITLAKSRDWLVFLHEVAHVWEYRKHGKTEHRRRMIRYVDRLCRYAVKMGWPQRDLDEQFAAWAQTQVEHEATEAFTAQVEAQLAIEENDVTAGLVTSYVNATPIPWPEPFFAVHAAGKVEHVPVTDYVAAKAPADVRAAQRATKIESREAQLARLERKIKNLTTRAAKVRRSLNALRRAQAPHTSG